MINSFKLAWLSLTYACNNKCKWCYASSNIYQKIKGKALPKEKIEGVVNLIGSLGIPRITLIGGEPTVYPYLEDVVSNLHGKNIFMGLVTNGRELRNREYTRRLKENGLLNATFSIEGSCPESHDSTTQVQGSFNQALNGIRVCQEEGLNVTTNALISKLSSIPGELERTIDMLYSVGIRTMSFNICGVCITEESNNENLLNPREAIQLFERAYSHSKTKEDLHVKLVTPMPRCNFNPSLYSELKEKKIIPGGACHIVHGKSFVIDYNGDIVPCTHLTGLPLLNIFDNGNVISKEEFLKRYNSPANISFREKMAHYPSAKCEGCEEFCSGGCPLYWIKFDPDKQIRGFD